MPPRLIRLGPCACFITFCSGSLFVITLPRYFWRMWRRGELAKRFWPAVFPDMTPGSSKPSPIGTRFWMHAVSVGEVNVCTQLISVLEPRVPNMKFRRLDDDDNRAWSSLQKKLPTHISKIYYPIDHRGWVRRRPERDSAPKPLSWSKPKSGPTFCGGPSTCASRSSS